MSDESIDDAVESAAALSKTFDELQIKSNSLVISANGFASAMGRAFVQSASGGKQFDDVLKSLALRLSGLAVTQAFKPIAASLGSGLNSMFSSLFGAAPMPQQMATGGIKPFASGGVIGTPTYFPMSSGGVGLAGEAGPEAIMPLTRGPDGTLGVASSGSGGGNVTIHIATPDADSFRRSQTYITGQIARAVARGQRSL